MRDQDVSNSDLARRLGLHERVIRRMLDPEHATILGVITVDDVLEVTLPEDWRRREAAEPPDAHHGDSS